MNSKKRIQLFEKTDERYNLALPFALLPFVIIGGYYRWGSTLEESLFLNFIASIFLISTLHLGFTIANIISLPEYQTYMRISQRVLKFPLWLWWLSVYLFLIILGLVVYGLLFYNKNWDYLFLAKLYFGVYFLSSRIHTIMQIKGLAKIYNFKSKQTPNYIRIIKEERAQKLETVGIYILAVLCSIQAFTFAFFPRTAHFRPLEIFSIIASLIVVIFLFLNIKNQPQLHNSSKRTYMYRLFYYPFTPSIGLATIATEIIHGIEYLFVTRELKGHSRMKSSSKWILLITLFCGFISVTWLLSSHQSFVKLLYKNTQKEIPTIFLVFSSINVANAFIHFYLDSIIFKFKNPIVRRHIGPLVSPSLNQHERLHA